MSAPLQGAPLSWGWRFFAWPIALLAWILVRGLAATWRLRVAHGAERVETLLRDGGPYLLCAWHAGLYPVASWVLSSALRRRLSPAFLVSRSRDGELAARVLRLWGARVVRGSSSSGGREALRALHRLIRQEGVSVFALPDGPRGPERVFKPGTFVLAQVAGARVLPLAVKASSAWRLRSWDRLLVPKPFSLVELAVGEPESLPPHLDSASQAVALRALEARLEGLERALSPR